MYCASFVGKIPSSCQLLSSRGVFREKKKKKQCRHERRKGVWTLRRSSDHRSLEDPILIGRNGIFLSEEDKNGPRNIASYHWNLYRSADRARLSRSVSSSVSSLEAQNWTSIYENFPNRSIFNFSIRDSKDGRCKTSDLIKFVERGRILREEDGIFFFVGFIINPEIFEDHRNWN